MAIMDRLSAACTFFSTERQPIVTYNAAQLGTLAKRSGRDAGYSFDLPTHLHSTCLIRQRDDFTLTTCHVFTLILIQPVLIKRWAAKYSDMFLNTRKVGHYVMPQQQHISSPILSFYRSAVNLLTYLLTYLLIH